MPGYYVYTLGDDGHVRGRTAIFCKDDEEAKVCAKALVNGHDIELWQLDRKIAEFKSER